MRLVTTTNVSVDGVMQGLGGPDEDRRDGFVRGGWALPLVDAETGDYLNQVYSGAAAFLFGRRTYEIFAGYWGAFNDPSMNPIAAALNGRPKYVVSTTLTDPTWAGTSVVTGDIAEAINGLKGTGDGTLLVPGSGELVRWLLSRNLVDQFDLVVYPVVIGQGTRLFPHAGQDSALELVSSRSTPGGIAIQTYRPIGRPEYATSVPDPNAAPQPGVSKTPERPPTDDAQELLLTLRADLLAAMTARRAETVSALRTAIAAVENAGAVEAPSPPTEVPSRHVAGARAGIGSTEVARRDLSMSDVRAILQAEVDERLAEADRYDALEQPDASRRLRREADALQRYLG